MSTPTTEVTKTVAGRTAKAPKAPQDRKPKAVAAEAAEAENVTEFEFEGRTFTGYGDNITGETMDELEKGLLHVAVRHLLGEEQWEVAKKYPLRKLKTLWETWGEAAGQGNS